MHTTEKELQETLERVEYALKTLNGTNLIIENEHEEILVGRSVYGEKKFMLPGGAIERGETPRHAAQSETEEETGYLIQEDDCNLIGYFIQRRPGVQSATGFNFLFHTTQYMEGHMNNKREMTNIQFMSIESIIEKREDFGLAYLRMIVYFSKFKSGLLKSPIEKRLAEQVEYITSDKQIIVL